MTLNGYSPLPRGPCVSTSPTRRLSEKGLWKVLVTYLPSVASHLTLSSCVLNVTTVSEPPYCGSPGAPAAAAVPSSPAAAAHSGSAARLNSSAATSTFSKCENPHEDSLLSD